MDLITLTHQIAMSLHRVGLAGAAVDLERFHALGKGWQQDAARLHDKLVKFALRRGMEQFVATNDNHIRELVYDRLDYPVVEKTKKSKEPVVSKPILKRLVSEATDQKWQVPNQFITDLIEFNAKDKLASTWYGKEEGTSNRKKAVGQLLQCIPAREGDARVDLGLLHFWIFPLRARTGRRTSGGGEEGDPESRNSQNWPQPARNVIVSRWRGRKNGKIAICDYSKLEVVVMGWRAGDEKLLDYFLRGTGYIGVAKEFWGQDVEDGTPMYKATKALVLGLDYNMGWWKLANDLWFKNNFKFSEDWDEHCKETKKARKRYLRMFPGLKRYIQERIVEVSTTQQVVSPSGRIRHLPHHGVDSEGFWHLKNSGINFPIQSFASDITGSAIVDYEEALLREHKLSFTDWHSALLQHPWDLPCSPVFNEVHDELDLDLHPRTGKRDLEMLLDCMRNVRTLKKLVPGFDLTLKVDAQIVERWGDAK